MAGLNSFIPRFAERIAPDQRGDLVDHLSRDLDHVRDRRDALASDVTALTTQIATLETRIAEERERRERERIGGEIKEIKKRLEETAAAFAPAISRLCDASETAATRVPEARALNGLLSSVATEVDTVIASLLHELELQAEAVTLGPAAPGLSASA